MAKENKQTVEKVIEKEQESTSGLLISAGQIEHSDYDTTAWEDLIQDYTKMRNGDSIASSTVDLLKYPILQAEFRLDDDSKTEQSKEAVDYLYFCFDNIQKGLGYLLYHKLLALDFGMSMHEVIIKRAVKYGKKLTNMIVKMAPIQLETIFQFRYDSQINFLGINHERRRPDEGSEFVDIDAEKLDIFTYGEEFEDIRGRAILRPARVPWLSKQKVIESQTRAIFRGAGIPLIGVDGNPGSAGGTELGTIGRTIMGLDNSYLAYNRQKMEIELVGLKDQGNAIPFLEFLNREIFFNTMTEFMTSGIGQSGSRASTSEHKGAYELAAGYVLKLLEENMQVLVNRMINISYLANMPQAEYPKFRLSTVTSADKEKMIENGKILYETGMIAKKPEDERFWREAFGMPEIVIQQLPSENALPIENNEMQKKLYGEFERNPKLETNGKELIKVQYDDKNDYNKIVDEVTQELESHQHQTRELTLIEQNVFELQSALVTYDDSKIRADEVIKDIQKKILDDIGQQLSAGHKKPVEIRYKKELYSRLEKIYLDSYGKGKEDMSKELSKVYKGQLEEGYTPRLTGTAKENRFKRDIDKFALEIKTAIENRMSELSSQAIIKAGGVKEYLTKFEDAFKSPKRNLITDIGAGYLDGRAGVIERNGGKNILYTYSAILDQNICGECSPLDNIEYSLQEIFDLGLNLDSPINPQCAGQDKCRCVFIPSGIDESISGKESFYQEPVSGKEKAGIEVGFE